MIDYTELPTTRKAYGGANGGKIAVICGFMLPRITS